RPFRLNPCCMMQAIDAQDLLHPPIFNDAALVQASECGSFEKVAPDMMGIYVVVKDTVFTTRRKRRLVDYAENVPDILLLCRFAIASDRCRAHICLPHDVVVRGRTPAIGTWLRSWQGESIVHLCKGDREREIVIARNGEFLSVLGDRDCVGKRHLPRIVPTK